MFAFQLSVLFTDPVHGICMSVSYTVCIYRHIVYSVGKSSHMYCRLGIAGQPQFSWKYAGFICLTVFYAQATDAQHDRLCVECVCVCMCLVLYRALSEDMNNFTNICLRNTSVFTPAHTHCL